MRRIKVEDKIVEIGRCDAIRFDRDTTGNVEAGRTASGWSRSGAGEDPRDAGMIDNRWRSAEDGG